MESSSRAAALAAILGVGAVGLCILGPVLIQLGLVTPMGGFGAYMLGNLLALAALVCGGIGLAATRVSAGRSGRGRAAIGLTAGLVIIGTAVFVNLSAGGPPRINDITTDLDDPPVFVVARTLEPNRGRDLTYPGESFASQQRAAYSDLAPIERSCAPTQCFDDVRRVAGELGWEITAEDTEAGTLEATHTSRLFHFVDDISVRIRPAAGGSRIDIRSKSRDGQSDIGANAARIRTFRDALPNA